MVPTSSDLNQLLKWPDLRTRRHDLLEAQQTLRYIIGMVEAGYDFKDQDATPLLAEMKKVVRVLESEITCLQEDNGALQS